VGLSFTLTIPIQKFTLLRDSLEKIVNIICYPKCAICGGFWTPHGQSIELVDKLLELEAQNAIYTT
jgi:hypothetical protein